MQDLLRIIETPRTCSYLPNEMESLELRLIEEMNPAEYADLLARGYRRFGWQVFRPACRQCSQCISVRVLLQQYTPGASERRILRKNSGIRAELEPLSATRAHVELYNGYQSFMHEHRGWRLQQADLGSYRDGFLSGAPALGRQWAYYAEDRLIGIAFMDEALDSISLVYCFCDPQWRRNSLGTFSIVNQLLYAKERGLRYAYLGYWIEACQSMSYKDRFRPFEILREYPDDSADPVWEASRQD